MTSCNNIIGFDGELLNDLKIVRNSTPAHLTLNMWVLNIFETPDKPESLVRSLDLANVDLKFE